LPKFEQARSFAEGLAEVKVDGKWGFVDHKGRLVIPARFDETAGFDETGGRGGLAPARIGDKWGYIGSDGAFRIKQSFEAAKAFQSGLAEVQVDHRMAYIDSTGKVVWKASR
jgi:hypothetical protein